MYNNLLEKIYKDGIENYFLENYKFNGEIKEDKGYFAFDIETTNKEDKECILYSSMIMDVKDDICYHNSCVEELVDNLEKLPYITNFIYAHNGGKFDYKCILGEFLKRGYTIKESTIKDSSIGNYKESVYTCLKNSDEKMINVLYKDNKFYKIEINVSLIVKDSYKRDYRDKNGVIHKKGDPKKTVAKKLILLDSCLMLTGSLKSVAKGFLGLNLSKDGLDYSVFRDKGYKLTEEEKKYCYEDVYALKHLIKEEFIKPFIVEIDGYTVFNNCKSDYLTSASFSLDIFKHFLYFDCVVTRNYLSNYSSDKAKKMVKEFLIKCANDTHFKCNKDNLFSFLFPELKHEKDIIVRETYFGGLCGNGDSIHKVNNKGKYNNRPMNINGCVLDENSMYPDKMKNSYLPFGYGTFVNEIDFINYYGQELNQNYSFFGQFDLIGKVRLKKNKFPTIRVSGVHNSSFSKKDIFISNNVNGIDLDIHAYFNSIDYFDFIDSYKCNKIIPKKILLFNNNKGFFDSFIDYFYDIKCHSTGSKKANAKLVLNSTYGKFGTKKLSPIYEHSYDKNCNVFKSTKLDEECLDKGVFVPLASMVTGYARHDLKTVAESVGVQYVDYFDTDSLHFRTSIENVKKNFTKIDPVKLGYWDCESFINGGIYLGPKRYAELIRQADNSYKWDVKCCGIPQDDKKYFEDNIDMFDFADITKKEFDKYLNGGQIQINSFNGYNYFTLNGKLIKGISVTKKSKLVKNGVVIKNTPYIIS